MKCLNNKGYLLIEILAAVCIGMLVFGTTYVVLMKVVKSWSNNESRLEITYNLRDAMDYISDEIRSSSGVEILDSSENGWIKVYKNTDKSSFTTFRLKNGKLFVGFGNTLNPNSEISRFIKTFKVTYFPEGVTDPQKASGVNVLFEFERNNQKLEMSTSLAFRVK